MYYMRNADSFHAVRDYKIHQTILHAQCRFPKTRAPGHPATATIPSPSSDFHPVRDYKKERVIQKEYLLFIVIGDLI